MAQLTHSQLLKWIRTGAVVVALLILGTGLGYWGATSGALKRFSGRPVVVNRTFTPKEIDFSLFWEVWDKLHAEYLDQEKLDDEAMVYGAIQGMTAAIDDPYTVFLPPQENQQAKEDLDGAFEGVGIQLGFIDRQLAVVSPLEGHPAKAAGVKAGDLIVRIRDESKDVDTETQGMNLPEAVQLIRGKKGTTVELTVLHEGEQESEVIAITRAEIVVPSVEVEFGNVVNGTWQIDKDPSTSHSTLRDEPSGSDSKSSGQAVAWLKLYRFGELTEEQWSEAVRKILLAKNAGVFAGIVLDLRNNPGGFLSGSVFVASEFIDSGVVVTQRGKFESLDFNVERAGRLIGTDVVVLVNKGSASASEIVAGALRDRLKVKLVGEQTFGKGTVQDAQDLRDGAGIHITTGEWLLPSGENISDEGLAPDVEVALPEATDSGETVDTQLLKAVEVLLAQ